VIAQIGMNEANYLDAPLPLARAATTYSKRGDWPILFVILSTLLGCAVRPRRIWN
jgi:apolipoprotein N-acyltransferase